MLIDWKTFPEMPTARAGATRRGMCGGKISAVRINLPADAPFNLRHHSHDNEQLLVIVSGELHFRVDENRFTARAGDMVFIPAGSVHGATGVGPQGCDYYEIFSPGRPDTLPGWIGPSVMNYE